MTDFIDWPQMDKDSLLQYLRFNSYRSERYGVLYVSTPKVACTSLKWWFAALEGKVQVLRAVTDSGESDPDLIIHDSFHKVAPDVIRLAPEIIESTLTSDSFFRFAVVRNPYKRIFSAWQSKLLLQEPLQIGPYTRCEFFNHPIKSSADIAAAFEGFLEHLVSSEAPTYWDLHWTPQAQLLRPDLISYSKIFKIEQSEELGAALTEWAGEYIPNPFAGRRANESLIPYLSEFVTPRSSELIQILYDQDFTVFGYDKEPPVSKEVFSEAQFDITFKAIKFVRARHRRLGERNVQCTNLSQAIVERDAHISALNQAMDEHAFQLAHLNRVAAQRDTQIADFNQVVLERDSLITSLEHTVFERDTQIAGLGHDIVKRDTQIAGLGHDIVKRDTQIDGLGHDIVKRDTQIASLDHDIVKRDAQIAGLDHDIVKRDAQIADLNHDIVKRDAQIADINQEIAEHQIQIASLNQAIIEREIQISTLVQSVDEYQSQVEGLNQVASELDVKVENLKRIAVERDDEIENLSQLIAVREGQISGSEESTVEYERRLTNLGQTIATQKAQVSHLEQIVVDRDGLIARLSHTIQERDEGLEGLSLRLVEHEGEISTLKGHAARLMLDTEWQVETAQHELSRLLRSRSWRLTAPLRKIVSTFRPKAKLSNTSFTGKVTDFLRVRRDLANRSSIRQIRASSFFDADYYVTTYPDVSAARMAPATHYFLYGWKEHRNPSIAFSTAQYLFDNPDVLQAGINPLYHYLKWGKKEGRQAPPLNVFEDQVSTPDLEHSISDQDFLQVQGECLSPSNNNVSIAGTAADFENEAVAVECSTTLEDCAFEIVDLPVETSEREVEVEVEVEAGNLACEPHKHNNDVTAMDAASMAIIEAEIEAIAKSGRFDESFYLSMYTGLNIESSEAIRHYCERGWKDGLNPSDDFDTKSYLSTYSDIRNANLNPFWHYVVAGASELRHAVPDSATRYENSIRFGVSDVDVKLLAFFSSPDWVSLRNGRPASKGSSQPSLPHDELGFYDSYNGKVLEHQTSLAQQHGLHGFCFELSDNGSGALREPVDLFLKLKEIDFRFCVQCELNSDDMAETLLTRITRAITDARYIKVDGRPVIVITLSCKSQYTSRVLGKLRSDLAKEGAGEVFLIVRNVLIGADTSKVYLSNFCDAVLDLPVNPVPDETGSFMPLNKNGVDVVPYTVIASQGVSRCQNESVSSCPQYHAVTLGRDNTAQKTERPLIYSRFHVRDYRRWLDAAILSAKHAHPEDRRFVFVNAWNDWNEGLFLEPDRQGGFGRLNETTRALLGIASGASMPKVSVIVPNYNHERFLRRRLDSIYGQTYKNIEVILLDDCSTDQSRALLNQYANANPETTRTLFSDVNSGGTFRQWAKGIKAATGELVWIAESDDYCDERFLEVLVNTFEDEAVLLAYAKSVFVSVDEVPMVDEFKMYVSDLECADKWNASYVETAHNEVKAALGIKNTIPNASGVLFKRPVELALLDDEAWLSMSAAGDWVFYLHQIRGGKIAYCTEATNFFRRYKGSAAESTYKKEVFYHELGLAGRTVQELYNVPLALLEQSQKSCKELYDYHSVGDEQKFLSWYRPDCILRAREERKPNILISTMGFYPGGAEILPIRMANEFKRQGLSVILLSAGLNPREDGVRRMLRNDVPLIETSDVDAVKTIIRDFGVEALNTHQWHIQKYPLHVPDVFDELGAHVASLHGMIEHGDAFGVTEAQLRTADSGVTTWVYTADKNLGPFSKFSLYDQSSPRFVKLPNGMMPSAVVPVPRAHMGIPEEAFVLCCVSRAIPDKGWAEAILAVEYARKLSGRDIRLILVGNGPVYDEYCRTGTPDFVYLAGFSENSVGHYASADMGIMLTTFKSESFPLTIVDCLFAGKPYIASAVGDIKNMLSTQDDIAGAVIGLEDWEVPIKEAGAVIAAFATDKVRYNKASELVPLVANRYKIDVVAKQYVEIFQRDILLSRIEADSNC